MGVVSECCCKEVLYIIDILIIIITFPYSTCINSFFGSIIPISLFIFKCFLVLILCLDSAATESVRTVR